MKKEKIKPFMENGKYLLDTFQKHLHRNFETYCKRHGWVADNKNFITYLIDRQLLAASAIRRYTIIEEFDGLFSKQNFHKSKTVATLADRFQLSDRHIWSLLKYSESIGQRKKHNK